MIGAVINSGGIVAGGLLALAQKRPMAAKHQAAFKIVMGVFTLWFGLKLTWANVNGSFGQVLKQLAIVLLAMALGKIIGKLLRLQKFSNSIGQFATRKMSGGGDKKQFSEGFMVAVGLFCAAPLGILGSVQEGLNGFAPVLVVKAIMDGLATMAFVGIFGWSAMASAIPVLAFEGAIIRCVGLLEPVLHHQSSPMMDSVNATAGLLIFAVALIILEIKKIEVADYLPSLVLAPLLTWWLW